MILDGLPLSCLSATMVLAYCHYYTCKFIPGRYLTNTDLQTLITWLDGSHHTPTRSLRQHPGLAVHITLLQAADLLTHNNAVWHLTPSANAWLQLPPKQQCSHLLQTIEMCRFRTTAESLALTNTITEDLIAYTHQQLVYQQKSPPPHTRTGHWLQTTAAEWLLCCPLTLPNNSIFHLLQLGTLKAVSHSTHEMALSISALTIAQADRTGYSLSYMRYIMEEATGQLLTPDQQMQFLDWIKQSEAYTLKPVTLLTVKQPHQLAAVIENGNLRQYIHSQLSPRHAIVSPHILPSLKKWTIRQNQLLNSVCEKPNHKNALATDTPNSYTYLALHLLTELGSLIPPLYTPPTTLLEQVANQLTPEQKAELNHLAQQTIAHLQEAIAGRDAFFPARQSPTPWLIQQLNQAIEQQTTVAIQYLPLNALEPKRHTLEPHRLEKRGGLYYLHAYSHRAEANLTFRLDRIHQIAQSDC